MFFYKLLAKKEKQESNVEYLPQSAEQTVTSKQAPKITKDMPIMEIPTPEQETTNTSFEKQEIQQELKNNPSTQIMEQLKVIELEELQKTEESQTNQIEQQEIESQADDLINRKRQLLDDFDKKLVMKGDD